ncbi:hypothetical protein GTU79_19600 [Sodalis ligni]|uniref:hypothetical protein n=1 Tax=Sodalis ligni TaxID=2697027 RepID=UPI00193FE5C3|nr:hypothetical protein [Sodalis ligni]QWA09547.1 hypothetical protein GTU79_19600 [Sodalis ligni]
MSDESDLPPDDSDNVLVFTKRFDANADIKEMRNFVKAPDAKSKNRWCTHPKILVDDHLRTLTCRSCGAVVDPFDWINSVTDGETKVDWELQTLRREITDHRTGLEKLKQEELNCRARVRTQQFKLSDLSAQIYKAGQELAFLTERLEQVKALRGSSK